MNNDLDYTVTTPLAALAEIHSQLENHPHQIEVWMFYVQKTKPRYSGDVPVQQEYLFLFELDACKYAVEWITKNRGARIEPERELISAWFDKSKLWRGDVLPMIISLKELPYRQRF